MNVLIVGVNRYHDFTLSRNVSTFVDTRAETLTLLNNDIIVIPGGLKGVENMIKVGITGQ